IDCPGRWISDDAPYLPAKATHLNPSAHEATLRYSRNRSVPRLPALAFQPRGLGEFQPCINHRPFASFVKLISELPPFGPDAWRKRRGLRISLRTGLCRRTISGSR